VLLPIVAEYAATTSEDMWADGLRVKATDPCDGMWKVIAGAMEEHLDVYV
jgi:hypothetical protein